MKTCPTCGVAKPLGAFPPNRQRSDGRQAQCRPCYATYQREYDRRRTASDPAYRSRQRVLRRNRRDARKSDDRLRLLDSLETHPCVDCGEAAPVVLEFDHRDPSGKSFAVADAIFWTSWDTIQREIEGCDVRCANCHRRRTARQRGFYSYLGRGA